MADPHSNRLFTGLRAIRDWFGASEAPGLLSRFMPRLGALTLVALLVGWQAG